MAKTGMTGGLFAPTPNKADSKARITDSAFRSIVDAEAVSRETKTERLRKLRLLREAEAPPAPEPKPKRKAPARAAKG